MLRSASTVLILTRKCASKNIGRLQLDLGDKLSEPGRGVNLSFRKTSTISEGIFVGKVPNCLPCVFGNIMDIDTKVFSSLRRIEWYCCVGSGGRGHAEETSAATPSTAALPTFYRIVHWTKPFDGYLPEPQCRSPMPQLRRYLYPQEAPQHSDDLAYL